MNIDEGWLFLVMDDIWRHILQRKIENPKEKQRIARAIGIESPRTLDRWAEGISTPRNHQVIRALKKAISSSDLDEALLSAFPDAFKLKAKVSFSHNSEEKEIASEFYRRVIRAYTVVQPKLRQWTIKNLVCMHMIRQLDPMNVGLAIIFVQMTHSQQYSHLVAQEDGYGTGIWDTRQLVSSCPVSFDSLVGRQIVTGLPSFIQRFTEEHTLLQPVLILREQIQSLAIYPIARAEAIAGGIMCCSKQQDFFTMHRKELVEEYIYLLGLAFHDHDFVSVQLQRDQDQDG